MTELQEATIAVARTYLGRQEEGRPNTGKLVDAWLQYVGCSPGVPWCAAFACAAIREAATAILAMPKFRKSAGALRLLDVNKDLQEREPDAGYLVVWNHGGGRGHVGIVTGVTRVDGELAAIRVIAGNTNADGSRDADSVVERDFTFPQSSAVAGYLRIA